eukprot:GFUD01039655.1.p1 GENE.GFUD01039655.1~~GFUD01039655.1.p1  ORF type:complete len:131 (-),score=40.58 GFUD01039655.1:91-483(-)
MKADEQEDGKGEVTDTSSVPSWPVTSRRGTDPQDGSPSFARHKDSMSKEQLLNEFFMLERRVNELEDMVFRQEQEYEVSTGDAQYQRKSKEASVGSDLSDQIQIHQEEIERLRKENKMLEVENRKRGAGR